MCDVCNVEEQDWRFKNGKDRPLAKGRLYGVYEGRTATISLCLLHDIELFMLGEKKFLFNHPKLAITLTTQKEKYASGM